MLCPAFSSRSRCCALADALIRSAAPLAPSCSPPLRRRAFSPTVAPPLFAAVLGSAKRSCRHVRPPRRPACHPHRCRARPPRCPAYCRALAAVFLLPRLSVAPLRLRRHARPRCVNARSLPPSRRSSSPLGSPLPSQALVVANVVSPGSARDKQTRGNYRDGQKKVRYQLFLSETSSIYPTNSQNIIK